MHLYLLHFSGVFEPRNVGEQMLFADCINDHANYILMFMIKLIQHVNNSSLYIDACAHGNSAYFFVI